MTILKADEKSWLSTSLETTNPLRIQRRLISMSGQSSLPILVDKETKGSLLHFASVDYAIIVRKGEKKVV